MYYLIICEHKPDTQDIRRSVNTAHLEHINTLKNRCGTFYADKVQCETDNPNGTLIIAEFNSLNDAKAWACADPFATAEVYARILVYPYRDL